jgi:hypothetical protein
MYCAKKAGRYSCRTVVISNSLHCTIGSFPCKYLGLPISNRKLRRSNLLNWVEKIADRLPSWKANLLNLAGRTTLVNSVLSGIPVYLLIALNVPSWVLKAIDKIRKAFLWKGRKEVNGGSCLVAWDIVTRPRCLGGLGMPNLRFMGWALQLRWIWFRKTDPSKPWYGLDFNVQKQVRDFFAISVVTIVGNGQNTFFWKDRWLNGETIAELAPAVAAAVAPKVAASRTVAQCLTNRSWVADIKPVLSINGIHQYLILWDLLENMVLTEEADKHIWRHTASGTFSSKSCYRAFFWGVYCF